MTKHKTRMSSNGQVVIPMEIRDQMGIKPGAKFVVSIDDDNIVLEPMQEEIRKEEPAGKDAEDSTEI